MTKRVFDLTTSLLLLIIVSPLLLFSLFLVFIEDYRNPIYTALRVGYHGSVFKMYKLRSMRVVVNKNSINSTSRNDPRITRIGALIRKFKIDELSQLVNVLIGNMSLVGPRPNVEQEVSLYTNAEMELLSVRPGITDIASVVFSDESDILAESYDPNLDYNRIIRPWKNRLALTCIHNSSLKFDFFVLLITVVNLFNRKIALKMTTYLLTSCNEDHLVLEIASRKIPLYPFPPIGASKVVDSTY